MKSKFGLLAALMVVIAMVSCSAAPGFDGAEAPRAAQPAAPEAKSATSNSGQGTQTSAGSQVTLPSAQERMVVRTANLSLTVDDPGAVMDQITALANDTGGYVVTSHSERRGDFRVLAITIRVPAESFDDVLKTLRGVAVRIDSDDVQAQDVTEEFSDLDAQIRNLEATEQQYLTFLQKTERIEEVLQIQEKLSQVRGDIERLKGRKQFLERSTAMSVISVTLTPLAMERDIVEPGWSANQTLREALRGAVVFGEALATIVIWLVVLAIPLAVVIAPFWLLIRWMRRRRPPRAPSGAQ